MSKSTVILCALLFVTVALAHDMNEYNKRKHEFDLNMCYYSINGAARELQQSYAKKTLSWEDYKHSSDVLNAISKDVGNEESIKFSKDIATQAGHIIFCNPEVAEKIRGITRTAAVAR